MNVDDLGVPICNFRAVVACHRRGGRTASDPYLDFPIIFFDRTKFSLTQHDGICSTDRSSFEVFPPQ